MNQPPPYYILFSHSSISGPPSHTFGHPVIQYHYADDSPLALSPHAPNEHVLVLDYDPTSASPPTIQSFSKHLAVSSLSTVEAPGAAAASDNDQKNDKMYIIDTLAISDCIIDRHPGDPKPAHIILEQFKRRCAVSVV